MPTCSFSSTAFPSEFIQTLCAATKQTRVRNTTQLSQARREWKTCLFFGCIDSQPCATAQTVAQHKGGILVEKKGCSSQMHTAEIREMLREGLQLLSLKSCWPSAYESALLVLVVGLARGRRPIVRSRVELKTVINALEFNFILLEI